MIPRIRKKWGNQNGESIAEVILSILIASLSLLMFAGAAVRSARMTTQSRENLEHYYGELGGMRSSYPASSVPSLSGEIILLTENGSPLPIQYHADQRVLYDITDGIDGMDGKRIISYSIRSDPFESP